MLASMRRLLSTTVLLPTVLLLASACGSPSDSSPSSPGAGGDGGAGTIDDPPLQPQCRAKTCTGDSCDSPPLKGDLLASDPLPRHNAPDVVTPPPPLIDRPIREGQKGGTYLRPVLPADHTTSDGRIALLRGGALMTLQAERLAGKPFIRQNAQIATKVFGTPVHMPRLVLSSLPSGSVMADNFLCEPTPDQPTTCGASNEDDCYDIKVIQAVKLPPADANGMVMESIPVHVRVINPKTAGAQVAVAQVAPQSQWRVTGRLPYTIMAEMLSTADGHMIFGRVIDKDHGTNVPLAYHLDSGKVAHAADSLFYAYAGNSCDVQTWFKRDAGGAYTSLRPIPAAPYDRRLRDKDGQPRYGIAAYPIRDAFGTAIPEDGVLPGSYPWIDREANNLLFSTMKPVIVTHALNARYPVERESGKLAFTNTVPRGFAVVGLWTSGKTVMLDGLFNNDDYGFSLDDTHRLELYKTPDSAVVVRVNGGGKGGTASLGLPNSVGNNAHIESPENIFNYHLGSLPSTVRDVVWDITRGLTTEEVVFDDFLDPHVLLLAEMNAAWKNSAAHANMGSYKDGFSTSGDRFAYDPGAIRLQNSATSAMYPIPAAGRVEGNARIEPVALGGVHGRGLWLEPDASMTFVFPQGTGAAVGDSTFYVGLFIDAREQLDGRRHILTLPGKGTGPTEVTLDDGNILRVVHGDGLAQFDLSCQVGSWSLAWHHLGLLFQSDGHVVALVDGNPVGDQALATPVHLTEGTLTVGGAGSDAAGVRGWYDEVRVVVEDEVHELGRGASVELLCNYARGTTVAVGADSPLRDAAEAAVPAQDRAVAVGALGDGDTDPLYCATNYSADYALGRDRLPAGTTMMRDAILQEDGAPLLYNKPRPDTTNRSFCTTCHVPSEADPTRPDSLTRKALTPGTVNADMDPRTQPMQPPSRGDEPAYVRGFIPRSWLDAPDGTQLPVRDRRGPIAVLQWLLR